MNTPPLSQEILTLAIQPKSSYFNSYCPLVPVLLIVLDQSDGVICHEAADRTAGVDGQGDGPVWAQDKPSGVEVEWLLVDVGADGRCHLSSVEPV